MVVLENADVVVAEGGLSESAVMNKGAIEVFRIHPVELSVRAVRCDRVHHGAVPEDIDSLDRPSAVKFDMDGSFCEQFGVAIGA